jgi:hypothetical protein
MNLFHVYIIKMDVLVLLFLFLYRITTKNIDKLYDGGASSRWSNPECSWTPGVLAAGCTCSCDEEKGYTTLKLQSFDQWCVEVLGNMMWEIRQRFPNAFLALASLKLHDRSRIVRFHDDATISKMRAIYVLIRLHVCFWRPQSLTGLRNKYWWLDVY